MLKKVRPPDGYSSNISSKVRMEGRTLKGLKSHDHHVLLQFLLPVAAKRSLPKNVVDVLIEVVNFFRQLCSRINKKSDLERMQGRIPLTLCHLERIFPPAFFDVMEHLPIHLASDALVAGCVSFRSMWPIERYLYTLKQYVFKDVDTKLNREPRNDDGESTIGRPLGQCTLKQLDRRTWNQAYKWVLDNYESLEQYKK
ncbi:hypothetical protein LIER_43723 [Lithospermum erythrorhizon]|uniref:DUF4218 domain-containing protein n=1 Tax=Lithospermum erythrorhizon TaxID=34254 RepID=A0AAV3QRM5_LITER